MVVFQHPPRPPRRPCRMLLRLLAACVLCGLTLKTAQMVMSVTPANKPHTSDHSRNRATVFAFAPTYAQALAASPSPSSSLRDAVAEVLSFLPADTKAAQNTSLIGQTNDLVNTRVRRRLQLLPPTLSPLFSAHDSMLSLLTIFDERPVNTVNPYKVCHLQNTCQQDGETVFFTKTPSQRDYLHNLYTSCCLHLAECTETNPEVTHFCSCFSPESRLVFELANETNLPTFEPQPSWMISQWLQTKKHHVAHFSYSIIQLHSILLHTKELDLPDKVGTLVFQDAEEPFSRFEEDLWRLIVDHGGTRALNELTDFRFLRGNKDSFGVKQRSCFASTHYTIRGDIYATSFEDLKVFKLAASQKYGIDMGLTNTSVLPNCPPRRAAIVVRKSGDRRMLNMNETIQFLHQKGIRSIDIISPSESDSLETQATQFSRYGFVVSSHSSQLTNMLYAHVGTVVIEVSPIYKHAFAHLGNVSGVKFLSSVGHEPEVTAEALKKTYRALRKECDFQKMIVDPYGYRCGLTKEEHVALSRADYRVNWNLLEVSVDEGLRHLEAQCAQAGEKWIL